MDVGSLSFSTAPGTVSISAALAKGSHCSLGGWTKRRVKPLCQQKQLQQLRSHQGHPKHQETQVPAPGLSPPQPPHHHKEQHKPGPFSCPSPCRASSATITRECWAAPRGVSSSSKGSSASWNVWWDSAGIARAPRDLCCVHLWLPECPGVFLVTTGPGAPGIPAGLPSSTRAFATFQNAG